MPGPAGLLTVKPRVLFTLSYAGRTWRIADRTCDPEDNNGNAYHYVGGLPSLDLFEEAPLFEVGEPTKIDIEIMPPSDLAALLSEHHVTSQMTGEVALWKPGDSWNCREIMVSGEVRISDIGMEAQPAKLSVTGYDPADDVSVYPSEGMVISDDTWATNGRNYDANDEGKPYPVPFGKAGVIRKAAANANVAAVPAYVINANTGAWTWYVRIPPGSPAPVPVTSNYYLIAGELIGQDYVTIWEDATGATATHYVYWATDDNGHDVSLARDVAAPFAPAIGQVYYSTFHLGAVNGSKNEMVTGAGDLIRYALERTSIRVDWRRAGPALAALNTFKLAGYWDQPSAPWAWLQDNVFPLVPCSWIPGPFGVYPIVWRWWADSSHATAHFLDGINCAIEGPIDLDGAENIVTSAGMDFAYGKRAGAWRHRRVWQAAGVAVNESESLYGRRAELLNAGKPTRDELSESDMIYSVQTANLSLAWRSMAYSQPMQVIRITAPGIGPSDRLAHLSAGDVVSITSARHNLTNRVAHVRKAGWVGAACYADLVLFTEP